MKYLKMLLYWVWLWTWGFIESFLGFWVFLFAIIFRKGKPRVNGYGILTPFGGNWGGLSLGVFQFCGEYDRLDRPEMFNLDFYNSTRKHEFGHSLQVCIFGPLWLIIVGIPSVIRYNYSMHHVTSADWYDSAWIEGSATRWGTKAINNIER